MPTQKITSLDDKLTFGKYKDKPIREVMQIDIQYAKWLTTAWSIIGVNAEIRNVIRNFEFVTR